MSLAGGVGGGAHEFRTVPTTLCSGPRHEVRHERGTPPHVAHHERFNLSAGRLHDEGTTGHWISQLPTPQLLGPVARQSAGVIRRQGKGLGCHDTEVFYVFVLQFPRQQTRASELLD
jgi:hypothetical protein